jgi:hypothetical protein
MKLNRWLLAIPAAGILAAAAVMLLVLNGDPAAPPEPCVPGTAGCADEAELSGTDAERLAARYAPVLYLRQQAAPCDRSGAAFEPLPVEAVLGNTDVALRRAPGGGLIAFGATAADLYALDEPAYLDLPGNPHRPGCRYETDARRLGESLPRVAYARLVREEGYEELALQYWFFYYFNDWNNKHEGDWEMIQLVFAATTASQALAIEPERVTYSQHSGGEIALWTDSKLRREGNRPVVYVAVGSQANHFGPHLYVGRAESGAGLGCDDASGPGRRVPLQAVLVSTEVGGADDAFAWLRYTGRWGELAGPEFDGPTGPNTKRQWTEPFSWEEGRRYSAVRAPSRDFLGPDATKAFCDVIAFSSDLLLPIILELPLVVAFVAAAGALGLLFSLTRTRYWPISVTPVRQRRRIGQVLLSAFNIYVLRLPAFLVIGLIFVPTALIMAALQWLLFSLSPVAPVVPLPQANIFQDAVLWFALAELEFGLAYGIVLGAATVALSRIEAGQPPRITESFRGMLRALPEFGRARLAAIVVVGLLSATVVGIPLALRQAVRWVFIEQAVLLDGLPARAAIQESARKAGADWWWTAGCVVGLGLVGLVAAPAAGIFLMLAFKSLPLIYVNLASALLYVALVPYVAIALALVYFDLSAREPAARA